MLFAGVVFALRVPPPLIWSDELASILFLWLAMLGAVIAFRRGEHMRMTALVGKLAPRARGFFEALALAAALGFLAADRSAGLRLRRRGELHHHPGAGDLECLARRRASRSASALMIAFALLRLRGRQLAQALRRSRWSAAIVGVFWLLGPSFRSARQSQPVVFFVGVVAAAVFAGVPIAFSSASPPSAISRSTTRVPTMVLVGRMDEGMSHLILLAVPLFVFLGLLIEMTGMARAMVRFLASLLGHVRGGLSYVLIGAMYLVSGISGSKAADMAAVAPALFPEMKARGAQARRSRRAALRHRRADRDDPALHRAHHHWLGHRRLDRRAVHRRAGAGLVLAVGSAASCAGATAATTCQVQRATGAEILRSLRHRAAGARPALRDPRRRRRRRRDRHRGLDHRHRLRLRRRPSDLPPVRLAAAHADAGRDRLAVGRDPAHHRRGLGMAWGLTQSGFSRTLAARDDGTAGRRRRFMAVSIVAFIVLGSVLEGIPAIVLFGPLLFPIAKAVGIHEVHYAMVVILAMGSAFSRRPSASAITPPARSAGSIRTRACGRSGRYMLALFARPLVVAAVPWLSSASCERGERECGRPDRTRVRR